jgi:hypothetical protein
MHADDFVALTNLIHRYASLMDDGDFDGVGALFAHAEWHTGNVVLRGSDELATALKDVVITYEGGRPHTKHLITNLCIEVGDDSTTAAATSYVTVLQAIPATFPLQVIFSNRHVDSLERADTGWRFTRRDNVHDLEGDVSHHKRARAVSQRAESTEPA